MNTVTIQSGQNIDTFLRQHRMNTRFELSAGFYQSGGAYAFSDLDFTMLGKGCELIGAGSRDTVIAISDVELPGNAAQMECITAGSRTFQSDYVAVRGLTISPVISAATKNVGVVGLHIWSDRCSVRDVQIKNITGRRRTDGISSEGFGLLVNHGGVAIRPGGSDIADIGVELMRDVPQSEQYVCACYVGYSYVLAPSSARRIVVTNPSNTPAHAAFGVNAGVRGSDWSTVGRWNRGVFCDVVGGAGSTIDGATLKVERVAFELRGGAGVRWSDITIRDSRIELAPPKDATYAAALVLADETGSKDGADFDGVTLDNCCVRGTPYVPPKDDPVPWTPQTFYLGSLDAKNARACGLLACRTKGAAFAPAIITHVSPPSGFEP